MEKRIVFKKPDGSIGIVIPTPKALEVMTIEDIAKKDVPKNLEYRIVDINEFPQSRNYRSAWVDNGEIDINLEKAKLIQKNLIVQKALERTPKNEFGEQDFTAIKAEINLIKLNEAKNLTELYNMWPNSINKRKEKREYKKNQK